MGWIQGVHITKHKEFARPLAQTLINIILVYIMNQFIRFTYNNIRIFKMISSPIKGMTKSDRLDKCYNIQFTIPPAYLVHWIFIINDRFITSKQISAICDIYKQKILNNDTSMFFQPYGNNLEIFQKKLNNIYPKDKSAKKQKIIINLIADPVNALKILTHLQKQNRIHEISQVLLYCPSSYGNHIVVKLMEDYGELIDQIDNLDQQIEKAKQSVEKWRRKFQIFRNVFPLSGQTFRQNSFMYRIRIHACIQMKSQKFSRYLQNFTKFLQVDTDYRLKLKNKIYPHQVLTITNVLKEAIKLYSNQEYDQFSNIILRLYQNPSIIFYQIINQGLKQFKCKDYGWQNISLPVCLIYRAIKIWYSKKQNQTLIKELYGDKDQFVLWRGGKIGRKQFQDYKLYAKQNIYCQFFSFISTSRNIKTAIKFLNESQTEIASFNCLFKFQMKKPANILSKKHHQLLYHGFAKMPQKNLNKNQEDQILLNNLTVGKIISVTEISYQKLCQMYSLQKIGMGNLEKFEKIKYIECEIGSIQNLLSNNHVNLENLETFETPKITSQKLHYKSVIQHYIQIIDAITKEKQFDFADAYALCNELTKQYNYLSSEIEKKIQENNNASQLQKQKTFSKFLYEKQNYLSKMAIVCHKMGKISQALIHSKMAIQKFKQLQNIDKNRQFKIHRQKLLQMYLHTSHLLIEEHSYHEAVESINRWIAQLERTEDPQLLYENKVVISRLKLDLGVVYFKKGKISQAVQKFKTSCSEVVKVLDHINYDDLNSQTFYISYLGQVFSKGLSWFFTNETHSFFKMKRQQNIDKATQRYGGSQKLLNLRKNAIEFQQKAVDCMTSCKKYFNNIEEYQKMIYQRQLNVEQEQKQLCDQNKLKRLIQNANTDEQQKIEEIIFLNQVSNKGQIMIRQMHKQLIQDKKANYAAIRQQQDLIVSEKQKLSNLKLHFWQNPNLFLHCSKFEDKFSQMFVKKQENNRKILKLNDKITMEQICDYYKRSAQNILSYINKLQKLGYQKKTSKVLQQFHKLIQLYLQIGQKQKAQLIIDEIKRCAGQQKYYQLSLAYISKGKILYSEAQFDFLVIINDQTNAQKINQINKFRQNKINQALTQFQNADSFLKKSLQKQNQKDNEIYNLSTDRIEIILWTAKSFLVKLLATPQQQENLILNKISALFVQIFTGIQNIKTNNKYQLETEYYEAKGVYNFIVKKYKQSLKAFQECIERRMSKFGVVNWQNTETYAKIVFLFSKMAKYDEFRQKLQNYQIRIFQSCQRYKNYPFFWKIRLASYLIKKDRLSHKPIKVIEFIEETLNSMQKIGFADEYFYLEYECLYENQYDPFYKKNKGYLQGHKKLDKSERIRVQSQLPKENMDKLILRQQRGFMFRNRDLLMYHKNKKQSSYGLKQSSKQKKQDCLFFQEKNSPVAHTQSLNNKRKGRSSINLSKKISRQTSTSNRPSSSILFQDSKDIIRSNSVRHNKNVHLFKIYPYPSKPLQYQRDSSLQKIIKKNVQMYQEPKEKDKPAYSSEHFFPQQINFDNFYSENRNKRRIYRKK